MAKTGSELHSAVGSTLEAANRVFGGAWRSVTDGYEVARRSTTQAYGSARQYANRGYESSREYAKAGVDFAARMGNNLDELVRKQPVIAIVGVFAIGYGAAYLVRRIATPKPPPNRGWRLIQHR